MKPNNNKKTLLDFVSLQEGADFFSYYDEELNDETIQIAEVWNYVFPSNSLALLLRSANSYKTVYFKASFRYVLLKCCEILTCSAIPIHQLSVL